MRGQSDVAGASRESRARHVPHPEPESPVVVAFEEPRPPLLLTREEFLRRLDRSRGGS